MEPFAAFIAALADRYRIQHEVGGGGMARVFKALDVRHDRFVAVKVLLPELVPHLGIERFQREIGIAGRLSHPHIVPLLDSGVADGMPFYVMPLVEGETLRDRLERERQLPIHDSVRIAREVCEALAYAHRAGVVHRDMKPENVLLADGHARVADFGIARAVGAAAGPSLTSTGLTLGTPGYMSPEQILGTDVDARGDQYAVACILYEMLAGQPPFTAATAEALAGQHIAAPPVPVTNIRPSVPPHVRDALQRALAKTPADRHRDVSAFAAALGPDHGSLPGDAAAAASGPAPASRFDRRTVPRSLVAVVAGAVALALVAWGVASWRVRSRFASTTGPRPWVLVAEFDGPPREANLASGARDLVRAALDQSGLVTTLPQDQVSRALRLAGKPDSTRVDATLGRELAFRNSIRTVLEGRLSRLGTGLAIVLRLVDSERGDAVLVESASCSRDDQLIATLGRLTRRLRERMGESRAAIAANRRLEEISTPSFEAFQGIQEGHRLARRGDFTGSMAAYRRALSLDPDCAEAYVAMADVYHSVEMPDSALWAIEQALRRPSRLTEPKRLSLEITRADTWGDFPEATRLCDQFVTLYPNDPLAVDVWLERSALMMWAGRDSEGVASGWEAVRREPIDDSGSSLMLCLALAQAGQYSRADSILAHHPDPTLFRGVIALLRSDWRAVDSLATVVESRANPERTVFALEGRAGHAGATGSFAAANGILGRAARLWQPRESPGDPEQYALLLAQLDLVALSAVPARRRGSEAHDLVIQAWRAALAGRAPETDRYLDELSHCTPAARAHVGAAPTFVRAVLAFRQGRWSAVVDSLADIARDGRDIGYLRWNRIGPTTERWLVAEAYRHAGQPDSSAAFLERIAALCQFNDRVPNLMTRNLARLRLVEVYAAQGRRENANRQWAQLGDLLASPDPIVRDRIESAQRAMSRLQ